MTMIFCKFECELDLDSTVCCLTFVEFIKRISDGDSVGIIVGSTVGSTDGEIVGFTTFVGSADGFPVYLNVTYVIVIVIYFG